MKLLLQLLLNGIVNGAIYAVVAVGFSLVYNTTKIFHISYAAFYMLPAYFLLTFWNFWHIPLFLSIVLVICVTAVISLLNFKMIYKPMILNLNSPETILIASLGLMIVFINVIAMIFGNETKILSNELSGSFSFGGYIITVNQIWQVGISLFLLAGFLVFLKFSGIGIRFRALRDDRELFEVLGHNSEKYLSYIFLLSGAFVAVASMLVAYDVGMDPYVGMPMLLNGMVAMIIGGIGRFDTPILGGFILGIIQALAVWKFSASWNDAITFTILILFLLFKPEGLLGEKVRRY